MDFLTVIISVIITFIFHKTFRWRRYLYKQKKECILQAVRELSPYAYGVNISQWVEEKTNYRISIGGIYYILEELEDEGLIGSTEGPFKLERRSRITYFVAK